MRLQTVNREDRLPLPRLVLIGGKPGSGKTTLAKELASPEYLGLPLLARDAIKLGMVETYALAHPEESRSLIETDELRSTLVPDSFTLFYKTMTSWLDMGVSHIAEYGFDLRTESALKPIIKRADALFIHCTCSEPVAIERFIEREEREGRVRPDRLSNIGKRIELGTDPWSNFKLADIAVPLLTVNTSHGYDPGLDAITAFCSAPITRHG